MNEQVELTEEQKLEIQEREAKNKLIIDENAKRFESMKNRVKREEAE